MEVADDIRQKTPIGENGYIRVTKKERSDSSGLSKRKGVGTSLFQRIIEIV